MCTIVMATRVFEDAPLVIAANRDEAFARPAEGLQLRRFGDGPLVLAPLDLEAGGTWVGINRASMFVGITNRQSDNVVPGARSRGELVSQALSTPHLSEARRWASQVDCSRYNPFHLCVADPTGGFVLWNDDGRRRQYELEPGVHVLTERFAGIGAGEGARRGDTRRPERVLELTRTWSGGLRSPAPGPLQSLLADHRGRGMEDVRVVLPGSPYGTRSALTLHMGGDGHQGRLFWSDRSPRVDSFVDRSQLLASLFR